MRIADSNNFPATTMAAALVEIAPGGMRELHWHPLSDEWQYYISGTARMGVFHGEGRNNTVEFHPSDVGYVPQSIGHYVENIGKDTLRFLEVFATGEYADISLASWMNNVPHELVAAHLNIDVEHLEGDDAVEDAGDAGLRRGRFLRSVPGLEARPSAAQG